MRVIENYKKIALWPSEAGKSNVGLRVKIGAGKSAIKSQEHHFHGPERIERGGNSLF